MQFTQQSMLQILQMAFILFNFFTILLQRNRHPYNRSNILCAST